MPIFRVIRRSSVLAVLTAVAVTGAACSSGTQTSGGAAAPPAANGDARQLKGVCPDTIVAQTGWFPDITHNFYELLGDQYTVNAGKKSVTGPLVAPAGDGVVDTGVKLEIRSGGPAVGFQPTDALMWQDRSITLGSQGTDEQLLGASSNRVTTAVFAPLSRDPLVFMWDPAHHPDWNVLADIGQTDAKVLTINTDASTIYLTNAGIIRESQLGAGYDGSPSPFVAARGAVAMGGYSTKDPYTLEHIPQWGKKIDYAYVADAGYPNYRASVTVRKEDRSKLDGCLKRLVPIMQQAHVAFMARPDKTVKLVSALNDKYKSPYPYPVEIARYGWQIMKKDSLVDPGRGQPVGGYDLGSSSQSRVQKMIGIMQSVLSASKKPTPNVTVADIATNEYLDPHATLPTSG
jgi:hypothetical protein